MPTKKQRNAFYYFMIDKQQELRGAGKVVAMKDMPVIASAEWNKLSEAKKERYKLKAKYEKGTGGGASGGTPLPRPGRLDNTGVPLSERVDTFAELEERRRVEREQLKRQWNGKDVMFLKFYFIAVQYLCHVEDAEPHLSYPPVEISLLEYSMKDGMHESWHCIVHPGKIPTGFRYQAKLYSEQVHEIPPEGLEKESNTDYEQIFTDMKKFVSSDGITFPPLFAKKDQAYFVECSLQWLAYKAGVRNVFSKVYELNGLFIDLSAHIGGPGFSRFEVERMLSTFKYDHELGLRCSFHEELENNHCSLGEVNKYCFVLSDTLCPLYKISLTKSHLPMQENSSVSSLARSRGKQEQTYSGESEIHLAAREGSGGEQFNPGYDVSSQPPLGVQGAFLPFKSGGRGRGILSISGDNIRKPQKHF